MTTIPENHKKYMKDGLLALSRKLGNELLYSPHRLCCLLDFKLAKYRKCISSHGFTSRKSYFKELDKLDSKYSSKIENFHEEILELKELVEKTSNKEEWSVLRYIGESDPNDFDPPFTYLECYYWPTNIDNPVYRGAFDDGETSSYPHSTAKGDWEILEDPSGMARRILDSDDDDGDEFYENEGITFDTDFYSAKCAEKIPADFNVKYIGESDSIFKKGRIYHVSAILKGNYYDGCYHISFSENNEHNYYDTDPEDFERICG